MSAPSKKSDTRTTELIGMDIDGQIYLWSTGEVRPVTAFEDYRHGGLRLIKSGHYVIHWQGHAITVHCGSVLDGRKWKVGVQFMCSRGAPLCMPRTEVEAMLLGEVVRDPKAEERIPQQIIELTEAFTARYRAPHRRRMRMS
jgi:hypothetical protein